MCVCVCVVGGIGANWGRRRSRTRGECLSKPSELVFNPPAYNVSVLFVHFRARRPFSWVCGMFAGLGKNAADL